MKKAQPRINPAKPSDSFHYNPISNALSNLYRLAQSTCIAIFINGQYLCTGGIYFIVIAYATYYVLGGAI